jgi:hypothetical protein
VEGAAPSAPFKISAATARRPPDPGSFRTASSDPAIYERQNFRSLRLFERLGFSLASPEQDHSHSVEAGEMLMRREFL